MNQTTLDWRDWIGSREEASDIASLGSLQRMSATLDRDDPPPRRGDAVPPLWQAMYFPAVARHSALGPDGHPDRGGFLPPIPLPRRMFAGARAVYHRPLRAGEEIRREGEVADVTRKTGASGELVFVLVRTRIFGSHGLAIEEEHDIVYRDVTAPAKTSSKSETSIAKPDWRRTIKPDAVTLFRYSALTFNGHRIHYDRRYATEEEGYPGLVVHGPLIATYLAELCRDNVADCSIRRFAFRARRPLFDTAAFEVVGALDSTGDSCRLEAIDSEGAVAMTAEADFANADDDRKGRG